MAVFSPDVVAAVLHHMNDDHTADSVLFARAWGDPAADAATMVGLDENGGDWTYSVAGGPEKPLRVEWSTTISERPEIRREIVVLYDRACEILGVEPRAH